MKVAAQVGWGGPINLPGVPHRQTSFEVRTVFELLDVIRQKPGLFIGEQSISQLWGFLNGFQHALRAVENPFDPSDPPFHEFHDWIAARYGFEESTSGWRSMLLKTLLGDETAAFERFFLELDEFRGARKST